jgi:hypothetical protein
MGKKPDWTGLSSTRSSADGGATLLKDSGLPAAYWGYAYLAHRYVKNQTPSSVLEAGTMPYELIYRKKPDLSNLCIFGCFCYPAIESEERTKGGPRHRTAIFLGYEEGHIGWVRQDVVSQKFIFSWDVIFDELSPGQLGLPRSLPVPHPPSSDPVAASIAPGLVPSTCTARLQAITPSLADNVGCIAADWCESLRSAKRAVVTMAAVVNGGAMMGMDGGADVGSLVVGVRVDGVAAVADVAGLDGGAVAHLVVNGGVNGGARGGLTGVSGTQAEQWTVANEVDWPATLAASDYSELWTEDLVVDLLALAAYDNIPDQPEFITASTMEPDIVMEFCFAARTLAVSRWTR